MPLPIGLDTYIVSDLHLGEGFLPEPQRFSRLECFFYDLEFRNFTRAILAESEQRGKGAALILNGDIFDFLSVVRVPPEGSGPVPSRVEREFGLGSTEAHAVWKLERIAEGHPRFFQGLAELLAKGHHLAFTRGNHDQELFWPGVQRAIVQALANSLATHKLEAPALAEQVHFHQWFVYEPGRYWVEHGNQHERSNAVHYVMNPVLPPEYHPNREVQLDYPIGSAFVRFVYNKLRMLDPFTTHFATLDQYMGITTHHNFLDLLKTLSLHFPYFIRAIQQARVFEQQGLAPVQAEHEARLRALADQTGLGDRLVQVQRLQRRAVGVTKYNLLQQILRPVVRATLSSAAVLLLSLVTWFAIFSWIQSSPWLAEGILGRASLLAVLAVLTIAGLFVGFSFVNRALHRSSDELEPSDVAVAEQIATIVDVPFVSMGHTQGVELRHFTSRRGGFANSGTWIPHPGPWDIVKVRARQFTFVRLQGTQMDLLRWNDVHGTFEPVTLIEEYRPTALERLFVDPNDGGATTPEDP